MKNAAHTPGPWDYVQGTEHHGPYVTSDFGNTICDCYVMSNPHFPSVRNGGDSKPINHLHEMADPNARLIAAAPDLLEALKLARPILEGANSRCTGDTALILRVHAAIAKAEG